MTLDVLQRIAVARHLRSLPAWSMPYERVIAIATRRMCGDWPTVRKVLPTLPPVSVWSLPGYAWFDEAQKMGPEALELYEHYARSLP